MLLVEGAAVVMRSIGCRITACQVRARMGCTAEPLKPQVPERRLTAPAGPTASERDIRHVCHVAAVPGLRR
jgi:hypothetical protein